MTPGPGSRILIRARAASHADHTTPNPPAVAPRQSAEDLQTAALLCEAAYRTHLAPAAFHTHLTAARAKLPAAARAPITAHSTGGQR